jgi:hypothetical protein
MTPDNTAQWVDDVAALAPFRMVSPDVLVAEPPPELLPEPPPDDAPTGLQTLPTWTVPCPQLLTPPFVPASDVPGTELHAASSRAANGRALGLPLTDAPSRLSWLMFVLRPAASRSGKSPLLSEHPRMKRPSRLAPAQRRSSRLFPG